MLHSRSPRGQYHVLALGVLLGLGLSTGLQPLLTWHGHVFTLAEGVTRPSGGTVVVGLDQEPPNLDPHASPSAVTFQIIASVTENLLYMTHDRQLQPWLAESWEVSEDGTAFTFRLRQDVKFQDGEPLTAEVVKWNFDRIVDPNFKAGGALNALAGYSGAEVLDAYTVKVKFKNSYMPFLTYVASGVLSLVSPKAVQEHGEHFGQRPVGTGAYTVAEYVSKDHVTLVWNPDYNRTPPWGEHQGPAYVEKVVWKFVPEPGTRVTTVETGETQLINLVPSQDLPRLEKIKPCALPRCPGRVCRALSC